MQNKMNYNWIRMNFFTMENAWVTQKLHQTSNYMVTTSLYQHTYTMCYPYPIHQKQLMFLPIRLHTFITSPYTYILPTKLPTHSHPFPQKKTHTDHSTSIISPTKGHVAHSLNKRKTPSKPLHKFPSHITQSSSS